MWQQLVDVYKITEMRDGCVYKTRKLKSIWIDGRRNSEDDSELAKLHGGDILASTGKARFGKDCV